jgi:probable HAF family extracellular repeat protein
MDYQRIWSVGLGLLCSAILIVPGTAMAAAPQWVGVEYGEILMDNNDLEPQNLDVVDRADDDYCKLPPRMMNSRGEIVGMRRYKGNSYTVGVMTTWFPQVPSFWMTSARQAGFCQAADILQYDSETTDLSAGCCLNDSGVIGGWARVGEANVGTLWDGRSLHRIATAGANGSSNNVALPSSVRCLNAQGNGAASVTTLVDSDSGDLNTQIDLLYLVGPTGLIMHQLATQDSADSSSMDGGGIFGINASNYVVGYCWRHDPSSDYYVEDKLIHVNRPSAAIWDQNGNMVFNLYRDWGLIYSTAFDINAQGHVVGRYKSYRNAFLYRSKNDHVEIPSLAGEGVAPMAALSINASDHVCGWSTPASDNTNAHAFYWQAGSAPVDLGTMGVDRAWGLKIDDNVNIYGCVGDDFFSPDYQVRWSRETATDANGDGTPDTEQDNVVNYTAATGVPMVLSNPGGGALTDVQSWMEISNDASTYGVNSLLDLFIYSVWDTPLGYVHFKVPASAVGGTAHVQWKALTKLPYAQVKIVTNNNSNIEDEGVLFDSIQTTSTAAAEALTTSTVRVVSSTDGQGRLVLDLYLTDGGPSDCDGTANGSFEFFGGAVGTTAYAIQDYLLAQNFAAPIYEQLGVMYTAEQLRSMDRNGDGQVSVGDIIKDINHYGYLAPAPDLVPDAEWNAAKWGLN